MGIFTCALEEQEFLVDSTPSVESGIVLSFLEAHKTVVFFY